MASIMSSDGREKELLLPHSSSPTAPSKLNVRNSSDTSVKNTYSRKKCKKFFKNFRRRILKSRTVYFMLLINILQSFSSYAVVQSTVDKLLSHDNATNIEEQGKYDVNVGAVMFGLQVGFPALFYPIGGVLGDVYIGRHFISKLCLVVSFFSNLVISLALSLEGTITTLVSSGSTVYHVTTRVFGYIIPILGLLLIIVSDGIFKVSWFTFSADQLINSPSEEVSSYIYCWYWTKNFGNLLAILTVSFFTGFSISNTIYSEVMPSIIPFLSAIFLGITMFIDSCAQSSYDAERVNKNPIKQIFGVFFNALTSRPKKTPFTSAFRYGEDPPSGLDFAREYHGGKYSDEEVGDVKTCFRVFLMIIMISGFSAVYFAFITKLQYEVRLHQPINILQNLRFSIEEYLTSVIDTMLILLLVPLWNSLIFPLMGHFTPNTRKRIGTGKLLGVLAMSLMACMYSTHLKSDDIKDLFYILFIVIIVAESLVLIPGLEFIYAQGPDNMKGLLMGLHYFFIGVWAAIVILTNFKPLHSELSNKLYWYSYAGVGFIGLVLFGLTSICYKQRQRNNPISDIARISSYY